MKHFPSGRGIIKSHIRGREGQVPLSPARQKDKCSSERTRLVTLTQSAGERARGLAFADAGKAAAARKQVMGCDEQLGQECLLQAPPAEEDVCLHTPLKRHACSTGLGRFYRKSYLYAARQQRFPNLSANTNESCPGPLCKIKCHASPLNLTLHSYYTTSNHTRYQAVAKEKPRPALLHAA